MNRTGVALLSSLGAVAAAFVGGALFLWLVGKEPLTAYAILFRRGLGTPLAWSEILVKMAPLLIISAGLLIALKASVWNIGLDGQFLMGAALVGIIAPALAGQLPPGIVLLLAGGAGFLGGLMWGIIPAMLKAIYGLNEIITTIMMNFVAVFLTGWLVKGPFKEPTVVAPQMAAIPPAYRLPSLPFSERVHLGLIIGLLAVLLVYLLFRWTTLGFELTIIGHSQPAARHAGLPVRRLVMVAMLLSAGVAGLAGANDVLGVKGLFQGEWNPEYGLTAFALVFLARLNPLALIPFAFFFAFLLFGGEVMARTAQIPAFFVPLLEGLMLIFFALSTYFERRYWRWVEGQG